MDNIKGIGITWLSETGLTNLNSGEGGSNLVDIKKFMFRGAEFPYVSGQAMRAYLKESIRRNLVEGEYMCIPDAKGETCGDVTKCIQCDLFGFMIPKKKTQKSKGKGSSERTKEANQSNDEEETAGGAITRISPVKVAPAVGQFPFSGNSTLDFLTRRKPQEKTEERTGDIVNVELGKNLYKCGIDIDLQRVGKVEEINAKDRSVTLEEVVQEEKAVSRIKKVLEAVQYLSDYSKQARLLTDFTPDVICISFQRKYSHRVQKLFEFTKEYQDLNQQRVLDILSDLLQYSDPIYFGLINGAIPNESSIVDSVKSLGISVQRPNEALSAALKFIK